MRNLQGVLSSEQELGVGNGTSAAGVLANELGWQIISFPVSLSVILNTIFNFVNF